MRQNIHCLLSTYESPDSSPCGCLCRSCRCNVRFIETYRVVSTLKVHQEQEVCYFRHLIWNIPRLWGNVHNHLPMIRAPEVCCHDSRRRIIQYCQMPSCILLHVCCMSRHYAVKSCNDRSAIKPVIKTAGRHHFELCDVPPKASCHNTFAVQFRHLHQALVSTNSDLHDGGEREHLCDRRTRLHREFRFLSVNLLVR